LRQPLSILSKVLLVPVNGGAQPQVLPIPSPGDLIGFTSLSPDSKVVLYTWQNPDNLGMRAMMNVTSGQGGPVLHGFEFPIGGLLTNWSPDGRAIDYSITRGGITDLWRQPLSGGVPKQLTHFPSGLIYSFAWSTDGKFLAVARGSVTADIVLLKSAKKSAIAANLLARLAGRAIERSQVRAGTEHNCDCGWIRPAFR
jgi:Tol biopolymer transport system component